MAKSTIGKSKDIKDKLEYLGLDLDNIPKELMNFKPLEFRIPKFYDEMQYKQYRYVPIKDIEILLTPMTRLDEIEAKYKNASPISEYLDKDNEENLLKFTTFLDMLRRFNIDDVEKVKEEQNKLNKKIPFKVKYEGNYLWQIYYSETTDKYFMMVPTKDSDYSTFFFLLKKKLESKRSGKVFVPIRNVEYSNKYLEKSEFEDIENYMWLFTKDWPLIYEVYDKDGELSIYIVGETKVYDKIKSQFRIILDSKEKSKNFYKLLKAMFILQTELPSYFEFKTNIGKSGEIEFHIDSRKINFADIPKWLTEEYKMGEEKILETDKLIEENSKKLENLKSEVALLDIEYLAKEKQITTFLECKKSFFGKFKYYFKYSKKSNNNKIKNKKLKIEKEIQTEEDKNKKIKILKVKSFKEENKKKNKYTVEELIELYKELSDKEKELKNSVMDINALKLKKKNMQKKIENASLYISEIDSHKKSIFEFWKYTNKDEVSTLPEGEEEEVNVVKKIVKVFDYEEDLEKFGKTIDKMQRKVLSKDELDSVYLTSTNLIDILNKIKTNEFLPKDIETSLKEMKKEQVKEKVITEEEFDIFGGMVQDTTKTSKIKNKTHREIARDKFSILELNKNTKQIGYKLSLEKVIENIKKAIKKVIIPEDISVYIATSENKLSAKKINVFNINPEKEIEKALNKKEEKINFLKINLKENTNAISFSNIVFYDNKNKTLPTGQDLSTNILVDLESVKLKLKNKTRFKIVEFEDENDDFSKTDVVTINVLEYDAENRVEK